MKDIEAFCDSKRARAIADMALLVKQAREEGRKAGLEEAASVIANSPTPNDLLRWAILALKDKEPGK